MNSIYVIQNEDRYVIAATYEKEKALQICKENKNWSYREIPFYSCEGTEIKVIAGPIEMIKYFPKKKDLKNCFFNDKKDLL